jgi:asparagine synthase (glutamine-hydrolysing)
MPFFDSSVVNEIINYDKNLIIDKKNRRNKPIFRETIKNKLGVDTDKIGKKGYSLNTIKFICKNKDWICAEVLGCDLWNVIEINPLLDRLYKNTDRQKWSSKSSARLIYRLLLISLWFKNSKYIKHEH